MERLEEKRSGGNSRSALRTWGLLFLTMGIVSRSLLQNRYLGMGSVSAQELLEAMQGSESVMAFATAALVLQALETCAIPIFSFLLAEGMKKTKDLNQYLARVTGLALVTEIPYNFAMTGKILDFSGRNPVFGLVFALVAVFFFHRYPGKTVKNILIKALVALMAVVWCIMLKVEYGACTVVTVVVLWVLWDKPLLRNMAGASVVLVCSVFSMFLMAAPMSFLTIHFYNGEMREENRVLNYLAYPGLLLLAGVAGSLLL